MTDDIAAVNRQGMILSNFIRIRYGCDRRIGDLTLGDIIEICEFFRTLEKKKNTGIINRLKTFISQNKKRFHDFNERNLEELFRFTGYIKRVNGKTYYCVFQKIFERKITNSRSEVKILADNGLLIPRINGDFYHSQKLPSGVCKVFIIEGEQ